MLRVLAVMRIIALLMMLSSAQAGELRVQLNGDDGRPVPFAVLTLPGMSADSAAHPTRATVDQQERRFVPHVSTVTPGTQVFFPNSDDTRHHVYSFSAGNSFELQLYRANDAAPVTFDNAGIATVGCNIHDNMKAYVYVSDDATARVSDLDGRVHLQWQGTTLPTLLEIWHPQLQSSVQLSIAPIDDKILQINLPVVWEDPQIGKSELELEELLKRFSLDAN
ncbi:methylamine utilization protein [Kineobactrum sediminis]|uniref:Methylamine utilization protein n=1 Tax=Kineobactrum sediminis TaxID=1905677 RepID=A0A2N5Y242_9GAMM|nr:methylamine utilization protein [Kineobactrum sediminis]PLW82466.1 methylamine utilization protein [Kineobactrum sediminis]